MSQDTEQLSSEAGISRLILLKHRLPSCQEQQKDQ